MTNKKRAEKIKKLLGLNGQDNDTYYRVADVYVIYNIIAIIINIMKIKKQS